MDTHFFTTHHLDLSDTERVLFEKFLTLFIEYNSHTNLSAIRDEAGIIEKHFVDSLYGANIIADTLLQSPPVQSPRLLDIGSGGGFPGIPLKIVIPELSVMLLDSVGKKVKAMNHFVSELGLTDITAVQERAEVLAKHPEHKESYDFVVSRATAYITDILTWAKPFLTKNGRILLYKMPSDEEEKDRTRILSKLGLFLEGELPYTLGGRERCVLVIRRAR